MNSNKTQVQNLYYQKIAGPMAPFCNNALVHFKDNGDGSRSAHINAYLPALAKSSIKVIIESNAIIKNTRVEKQLSGDSLKGTKIKVLYTSKKGGGAYYLWQIGFDYTSDTNEDFRGVQEVVLIDTDPETTRGTVTTVKDPGT